ncbi:MAG: carboxypeptidase regulatory-like domain-containing protein [Candidatus Wallbacteria bacterium]|nr:carboxypeptidase regulatory-like domain-containing protein [Candidatus Wallbacteria bacterium]
MRHQALSGRLCAVALVPALLSLWAAIHERAPEVRIPEVPAPATSTAPAIPPVPVKPAPAAAPAAASSQEPKAPTGPVADVSGAVKDEVTGKPVQGAEVSLPELNRSVRTDSEGRFTFPAVPVRRRRHEVLVTCPGYTSASLEVKAEKPFATVVMPEVRLKPKGW